MTSGADQVVVVFNSAEDVEESVSGLVEEALVGGALAILVIFAFLRSLRATLVTAVSFADLGPGRAAVLLGATT